ncbi:hypothetical protein J5Y10_27500 [Roseomonas sp. SG15]|uniref:Tripartite tricarboxylate transporter substrate binding protein n=1 Tax=Roseomonas indoligenes TaxID=2820811 RepID=A0A940N9L7_9PROT|nr:hypothetical protein [Pararoseomonas indoligenes]
MVARATGAKLVHIPYPGSAPALTDVLQGRVPLMFDVWNSLRPSVETGKLRVLGLGSRTRIEGAPPMEPIASIVPDFDISSFFGLVAPGGTPPAVVQGIAADVRAIMEQPDMARRPRGVRKFHQDRHGAVAARCSGERHRGRALRPMPSPSGTAGRA